MRPDVLSAIKGIVGEDRASSEPEDLICYAYDAMNMGASPEAVVYPSSALEVSRILVLANKEKFPVVPRGAGTGMAGGAVPIRGGVVLSFEKMNRILKIDPENLVGVVEPGVVTGEFHREVEARGLFYPPDPASLDFCTLGGNVATCAGGLRAVKYGVTRDYVLGLEAVLPTGEIITTGVETVKRVVGYDLTRLLVGSEGTLGVVTKIILKLIPKPEARKTLLVSFRRMEDAVGTVSEIFKARILPATIEFMDRTCIRCVSEYTGISLPAGDEALLLIEDDGPPEVVERHGSIMADICTRMGATSVRVARDEREAEDLWKARRAVSPSLARLGPRKMNEDVVVPRNRLPDLVCAVREAAERHRVTNANFGHAGDGNLHVNILFDDADPDESSRAHAAVGEVMKSVVGLGGTISGEHGIGLAKKPYIGLEIGELGAFVLERIKRSFDPNGILNPGKIIP